MASRIKQISTFIKWFKHVGSCPLRTMQRHTVKTSVDMKFHIIIALPTTMARRAAEASAKILEQAIGRQGERRSWILPERFNLTVFSSQLFSQLSHFTSFIVEKKLACVLYGVIPSSALLRSSTPPSQNSMFFFRYSIEAFNWSKSLNFLSLYRYCRLSSM